MSERKSSYSGLIAGAVAGSIEAFVTYPTEYVKTRTQLSKQQSPLLKTTPTSLTTIIKQTFASDGITGFYRGCAPVVIGNAVKAGTRFYTFESIRNLLKGDEGKLSPGRNILAGMGAGAIESIVAVTPSESIKTRLIQGRASSTTLPRGNIAVIRSMVQQEGFLSLYKGLVPTILKQSANSATRFTSYEFMKDYFKSRSSDGQVTTTQVVLMGGAAGIITVYVTMPLDVIKTRMQQGGNLYKSSADCLIRTVREEGVLAFWKGASPRVARLTMSGSIIFTVYENVLKWLEPGKI